MSSSVAEPSSEKRSRRILGRLYASGEWRSRLWIWYLSFAALLAGLYLFAPSLAGNGPLINLLGLSSPIAIAVGIWIHRPRAWAAWALFAVGQFLFFAGDVYTYSYPKLTGADVPFPSLGDAIYLAVYPALMAGLIILVRRRNPRPDRAALIDSLILTIGVALLSWVFLIEPNLHLSGLSWVAKSVSIAYPLGDLLLLAVAIRLAVDAGKRAPAFYLLIASIVSLFLTDSAYAYALLVNGYNHQLSFDVGWIMYYVLWGAAALHPSMRSLEEPALGERTRLTRVRLILLGGACLISPAIRFVQNFHEREALVVICAAALLFLLVVTRMADLVRQEERAVSRELALRAAGAKLVAAAGAEQVREAAISAVDALLESEVVTRFVVFTDEEASVATSSEGPFGWPLAEEAADWLGLRGVSDETRECSFSAVPVRVRSELRLPEGRTILLLPLWVREGPLGMLVICSRTPLARELVDSLEALATQVSLAVEGASLAEDLHRRSSEARFRSLVAHASDLITVLDADGVVTYQSPSVERVLGYSVEEIEGTRFELLLAEPDRPRLAHILGSRKGSSVESHAMECSLRRRDGALIQFEVQHTELLDDEHVRGVVLNSRDVSERKVFEEQLAHQAFHDPVTNLANRALFSDRVQHALMRAQRAGATVAVMFIDLDDFKTVNDSLGHQAGDSVLQEVARRLVATVRPTDTVARFGGDEFSVLLDSVQDSADAAEAATRILRMLEVQIEVDGNKVFPGASIGICMAGPERLMPDAEELLRNADLAMYMAKRDTKGSYRMFEPAMHESVLERLELRSDLQLALESRQLDVHYQPVVRLDRPEIYGVEALLRWRHPTRGDIEPDQFVPIAEETGLIIPIGRWVLDKACRKGAQLQERFPRPQPLTMSVNLSVKQLQSETIVADVRHALETSGLAPTSLVLEITESVMLADTDLSVRRLQDLKLLGIQLAMDDFGTGYSSLSYLGRLPVDILKMDRSFLASRKNDSLASAIIGLGANLTLDVIAEGIEQPDQAISLRELGCEFGQGFLFGRAMNDDALVEFLSTETPTWPRLVEPPQSDAA